MEEKLERAAWKTLRVAAEVLGYTSMRENQLLIIKHYTRGCDVFVSMPTDSKKLLCYCLLPSSVLQQVETQHTKPKHTQPPEEKHLLMLTSALVNVVANHATELTASCAMETWKD